MVVAQQVPQPRPLNPVRRSHRGWVDLVLTISKLKRWSINYYIDTARAAETASRDVARAGGGLGEYYTEHETRTPTWLLAGDTHTVATLVGLTDAQRAGGEADAEAGGPLARRRRRTQRCAGARLRAARCARLRSDVLRTQERVARAGAARR